MKRGPLEPSKAVAGESFNALWASKWAEWSQMARFQGFKILWSKACKLALYTAASPLKRVQNVFFFFFCLVLKETRSTLPAAEGQSFDCCSGAPESPAGHITIIRRVTSGTCPICGFVPSFITLTDRAESQWYLRKREREIYRTHHVRSREYERCCQSDAPLSTPAPMQTSKN